ncbi:HAD family hydrolase [Duganella sp. LX20W]|uniref:HAD family hydrolase n=1 Tax=Rugamonas brunnea TaxID=2758569 RepID=A0A7W2EQR0_9BURK|nr:HAD family hydrolase [Rugamonas brunnea]MBA5636908.1 HAD family hydrolase [Rugamonas brunnea]
MSIDVIFLGLDGVLFDTEALHLAACNAAFAEAELSLRWTLPALRAAAATHGYANAITAAVAGAGLRDKAAVAALHAGKHRQFQLAVAANPPKASPAALALIDDALAAGCKLAVLSDLPAPVTAALLEHCFGADVTSLFSVVAGGVGFDDQAGPGPFGHALHAMGIEAAAAIAIDTVAPALKAAQQSGLWTVSVAPYGADVVRPQQFITFDALRELRTSPFTVNPQQADSLAA